MNSGAHKLRLLALLAALLLSGLLVGAVKKHEVFLPPDADVLTVVGNGFKLELSQFAEIKSKWEEAARQSSEVATPKTLGATASNGQDGIDAVLARELADEQQDQLQSEDSRTARQDQPDQQASQEQDYGLLDAELQGWIDMRVTSLIERLDRYSDELAGSARTEPEKVVVSILQLNTHAQLQDLVAEQLPSLAWLPKKLNALVQMNRFDRDSTHRVISNFAGSLMKENVQIETRTKGTNDPGKRWLKNSVALKRISNEQRFAKSLDNLILDFLARDFSMMRRATVMEIFQGARTIDTGLIYWAAKGRVTPDFPFSSQDAIANGAAF